MKEILYTCDSCDNKIVFANEKVEILGVINLPGNVSLSVAIHFHDDCLPRELHKVAQRALGNA